VLLNNLFILHRVLISIPRFSATSTSLHVLDEVQESCSNGRVSSEASGLKYQMFKFDFLISLLVLQDLLLKCRTVSDYLQREDIDIVSALQVMDATIETLKSMRNEATFKNFFDEALSLAREVGVEVIEARPRKVSRHLDDNPDTQHFMLHVEDKFRVTFFYEVIDILLSEFEMRFNQESRHYLTVLGDLQNRKIPDDTRIVSIAATSSLILLH